MIHQLTIVAHIRDIVTNSRSSLIQCIDHQCRKTVRPFSTRLCTYGPWCGCTHPMTRSSGEISRSVQLQRLLGPAAAVAWAAFILIQLFWGILGRKYGSDCLDEILERKLMPLRSELTRSFNWAFVAKWILGSANQRGQI